MMRPPVFYFFHVGMTSDAQENKTGNCYIGRQAILN
jgi:hypothetical protein